MIITYFRSFVSYEHGKLCHINLCDYDEGKSVIIGFNELNLFGYRIREIGKYVFILKDNKVLIANPDGSFSYENERILSNFSNDIINYCSIFIFKDSYKPFLIPNFKKSKNIPHIIHQTENSLNIDDQFIDNVIDLKSKNKDFNYVYYSQKDRIDFIYENYGWEILNYYLRINPRYGAAQADFFRYLCIYKCGGVYLDMKSGANRSFSEIIKPGDEFIYSQWPSEVSTSHKNWGLWPAISFVPGGEIMQWMIISQAGHPLIKKVIDQVIANISLYSEDIGGTGRAAVILLTGPVPYTRAIFPHLKNYNTRMIDYGVEKIVYNNLENYKRTSDYREQNTPVIL